MNENRLTDYLDHMRQAATDACSFIEGLSKEDFLADKRTRQAVIMSLIVIGEAATKIMELHAEFTDLHLEVPWRSMRGMRNRIAHGFSTSTSMWCGTRCRRLCPNCWNGCVNYETAIRRKPRLSA